MKIWKLAWSCLVLGFLGCPPTPIGECGGETCSAQQHCDPNTLHCVDGPDLPPIVEVAPIAPVTTAQFSLSGTITDDVHVVSSEWRIDDGPWSKLPLDGNAGTFAVTVDAPMKDGQLVIGLRARDAKSETTSEVRVQVDRLGPIIRITSPAADARVPASFRVEAQVEDVGGVADVSFTYGYGTEVFAATSEASGIWAAQLLSTAPQEGLRFFIANARDNFGHVSTVEMRVFYDNVAPTLTITSPADGSLHRNAADFVVSSSVDAARLTVTVDGIRSELAGSGTTWTGPVSLPSPLDGVPVNAVVTAYDEVGNRTSVDLSLVVDNVAPTLSVSSPSAGGFYGGSLSVAATTSGAVAASAMLEGQTAVLQGGPTAWTGSLLTPQRDFSQAQVRVRAIDAAGNTTDVDVPVNVDNVAPVVSFTAPTPGQKFNAVALSASSDVMSTWSVSDGDPQAATTTVNGSPSTGSSTTVATSLTDDGRTYTTNVTARDRAGNVGSASVSYGVDRVAPTIATWTPAANARNVDPLKSVVTFSEPVFGPLPTSPALTLRSAPSPTGDVWDLNHTRHTLPLDTQQGLVATVGLAAGLVDDFGNPFAGAADRKFHLVTTIASGSLLMSNVASFAASSDRDGAITIAALQLPGNTLKILQATRGAFSGFAVGDVGTRVEINSWNTFNPSTLESIPQFGVSLFNEAAPAGAQYKHFEYSNGTLSILAETGAGAVVSRQRLPHEVATGLTGKVIGSVYQRTPVSSTLPSAADMLIAQSDDSWAAVAFFASSGVVLWSRYRCNRDVVPGPTTYTCAGTEYATVLGVTLSEVHAAMSPGGGCLAVHGGAPNGNGWTIIQRLENCDGRLGVPPPAGCSSNLNLPVSSVTFPRMTSFSGGGRDAILFANTTGSGNYWLAQMQSSNCGGVVDSIQTFSVANVRDYAPIQFGNKAALLYVNTSNELRIVVP